MANKHNSDIAIAQHKDQATMVLGDKTGPNSTSLRWDVLRQALAGGFNQDYLTWFDHFLGDTLNGTYTPDLSTGATIACAGTLQGGAADFVTDTDDNDHATLVLGLHWLVSTGVTEFVCRLTNVTAFTLRAVEIGVSDAVSETNGLAFSSHDATPVAVADDAAVFAINSDESVVTWSLLQVNGGGTPTRQDSAVAPVAGTYQEFRIVITAAGAVSWFIDGTEVGTAVSSGIATTALLTPWITLKSLSGAAKTIRLDYLGMWGAL